MEEFDELIKNVDEALALVEQNLTLATNSLKSIREALKK